jgi:hypothetical protein
VKQPTRRTLAGHWGKGQKQAGLYGHRRRNGWFSHGLIRGSSSLQAYSSSLNGIQPVVRKFRRENEYKTTSIKRVITYIHCIRSFVKHRTPPHTAAIDSPHQSNK